MRRASTLMIPVMICDDAQPARWAGYDLPTRNAQKGRQRCLAAPLFDAAGGVNSRVSFCIFGYDDTWYIHAHTQNCVACTVAYMIWEESLRTAARPMFSRMLSASIAELTGSNPVCQRKG